VHGADPHRRRHLHPAQHSPPRRRDGCMTAASLTHSLAPTEGRKYGSMSADRRWALRWSYFFLVVFAIFFLTPPAYMLITSLKSSAEISAATNPWWVFNPTLGHYVELLTSPSYLTYFRHSAIVSIFT